MFGINYGLPKTFSWITVTSHRYVDCNKVYFTNTDAKIKSSLCRTNCQMSAMHVSCLELFFVLFCNKEITVCITAKYYLH